MSNSLVAIEKKDRFNGEAAVPQEGHCPDKSIEEGPNGGGEDESQSSSLVQWDPTI